MEAQRQKREWVEKIIQIGGPIAQLASIIVTASVINLNSYVVIAIGLGIVAVVMFVLLYRLREEDKRYITELKQKSEDAARRHWTETIQKPVIDWGQKEGAERMTRLTTYSTIISTFEKTVNEDTSLPDQERDVYRKIINRLKDMQSASQF
jgi:ABC-type anion transport system duplicated permease subunit